MFPLRLSFQDSREFFAKFPLKSKVEEVRVCEIQVQQRATVYLIHVQQNNLPFDFNYIISTVDLSTTEFRPEFPVCFIVNLDY